MGVYDDIVNIVSPGSFPNSITAEDIANGRSEARNKVVANVFKELGLIEQWGSGIHRIKINCKEVGLKEPKIEEQNDFVDVEFYRPITTESDRLATDTAGLMPDTAGYFSPQEKRILQYLQSNNTVTSKEVEKLLNIKERRARELLKQMAEKSLIIKLGSARRTCYEAVGDG